MEGFGLSALHRSSSWTLRRDLVICIPELHSASLPVDPQQRGGGENSKYLYPPSVQESSPGHVCSSVVVPFPEALRPRHPKVPRSCRERCPTRPHLALEGGFRV